LVTITHTDTLTCLQWYV